MKYDRPITCKPLLQNAIFICCRRTHAFKYLNNTTMYKLLLNLRNVRSREVSIHYDQNVKQFIFMSKGLKWNQH